MKAEMKSLMGAITAAQKDVQEANNALTRARNAFADKFCPVKVGDTVTINGCSHRGKKMIVKRVRLEFTHHEPTKFEVFGNVLKKDGTPMQFGTAETCYNFDGKPLNHLGGVIE